MAASIVGLCISFIVLEFFCRTYEPLRLRVRGGRIILPVSVRRKIHNDLIEKIDDEILHTRNRLGFRGREPPSDSDRYLTIVAVGGSTTECCFLSDGRTWPEQLGQRLAHRFDHAWVNNAGLDGQSTCGHAKPLDQYLVDLHPDVVRSVAKKQAVDLIDLARLMPKDLQYYYDHYHFMNEGAQRVSALVADQLIPILGEHVRKHRGMLSGTHAGLQ